MQLSSPPFLYHNTPWLKDTPCHIHWAAQTHLWTPSTGAWSTGERLNMPEPTKKGENQSCASLRHRLHSLMGNLLIKEQKVVKCFRMANLTKSRCSITNKHADNKLAALFCWFVSPFFILIWVWIMFFNQIGLNQQGLTSTCWVFSTAYGKHTQYTMLHYINKSKNAENCAFWVAWDEIDSLYTIKHNIC